MVFICFVPDVFSQENTNDYLTLLNEIDNYVKNNFISPFKNDGVEFFYNAYSGFGYKRNPFTGQIHFITDGVFGCNQNENIYSMTDGNIIRIGYSDMGRLIIIKSNDIEVQYSLIEPLNINEGDLIKKGQLIGRVCSPYLNAYGPALLLKIKYKGCYFDPYLLLYDIINEDE
jgi:murein DD-endopeptidase MepM/ murein hydrolase activator NlpD